MISVVTGGCGFIGSHLVDKLVSIGHRVVVIDNLSATENDDFYYSKCIKNTIYHIKDISKDDCSEYFENADYVFHLAAKSRIQPSIENPGECFQSNVIGTQNVLEWSKNANVSKVIFSSSSSVYGNNTEMPFKTTLPTDCLNHYSLSKKFGEDMCKLYSITSDLSCICLRYFNVYGPREPSKGKYATVIGLFKRQSANGDSMTIVGNGSQKRDFTYITDIIDANISAIDSKKEFDIYNVGTGQSYSILTVASMVGDYVSFIPERQFESKETCADIEKTVNELNWSPKVNIMDGINKY